jgi:spore coat polysaccharide biosynthesis protein SpsF
MKTVLIAQARMTSTRLPGKVLKSVLGKPLLAYFIERLRRASQLDQIVIATTINATDEPIVDFCREFSVAFTRGSEDDVLSRYFDAAVVTGADIVVRVTSDCPLIDPAVVDEAINYFKTNSSRFDYVSNSLAETYPRGMDVEVFSAHLLWEAQFEASLKHEREHVTPFFYTHPERYRIGHIHAARNLSHHRWTVDTAEDLELIKLLIETLYPLKPDFNLADILETLAAHPDWPLINANIRQKKLGQ